MTLRFERLEADFEILKARIGAVDAALPWIGRSPAPHAACAELLTPAARRVVERVFEADFERFGYDVMRVAA